ncbi:hypothetical protein HMPREF9249_00459 [Lactobacillus crispatus FB077-07]|uniref:Uncharacterized protein n=1 Tax=Lactobacillus crispatus FB077-07 TaxID=883092 RepID=K1NSN5_9LACO|nr:hypothetical protein HMPREF9249_00459 [Lactobacillus crispatus FB077-07]
MKINMILSFLRRTALFIATVFACLVSANAGALAQSICKFSTKHLNSNVNFAMAGFGISVIIYIFLWSIRYLKSDIKNQRN